ncbi:MAG: hypothetical protein CVU69_09460 [Deltaproteobacteria bacterium HGW-Deltaproteobacteria-4]|nr:MAG: hypothetical protein CVU69_09460 [Deltaproteobacteria bacterium HGW-Deltaproteobacteria-4]
MLLSSIANSDRDGPIRLADFPADSRISRHLPPYNKSKLLLLLVASAIYAGIIDVNNHKPQET